MKEYSVYLSSAEQFVYTFSARNLKELRTQIVNQWPNLYSGRWFKKDTSGCPKGSKRYLIDIKDNYPVLIIPRRKQL